MMPTYHRGHVRRPDKDHLIDLSWQRHGLRLGLLRALVAPPATWDSRAQGWVGPIKDQGQCGSCWDFSGTVVVEVAFYKAGIFKPDGSKSLSEEYTLSCARNGGCGGDDNTTVLDWAKSTGLPLSSDYGPYTAHAGSCAWRQGMTLYKIDDWGFAGPNKDQSVTDTASIKAAIQQYGCVGCAVDASFQDPGTGVISGRGTSIDHDVALVGWDDSKGRGGAWVMRNSWGTGWGNQGYAWIEYGAYSIGTEAVWAVVKNPNPPPSPIPWVFSDG